MWECGAGGVGGMECGVSGRGDEGSHGILGIYTLHRKLFCMYFLAMYLMY